MIFGPIKNAEEYKKEINQNFGVDANKVLIFFRQRIMRKQRFRNSNFLVTRSSEKKIIPGPISKAITDRKFMCIGSLGKFPEQVNMPNTGPFIRAKLPMHTTI